MAEENPILITNEGALYSVDYKGKKVSFNSLREASYYAEELRDFESLSNKPGGIKNDRCKTCVLDCICHICKANNDCYISSLDPCPHIKTCPNLNKGYERK